MYQSSIQVKKKERKIGMFLGKIRNPTFNNNDSSVLIFLRIKKKKKNYLYLQGIRKLITIYSIMKLRNF